MLALIARVPADQEECPGGALHGHHHCPERAAVRVQLAEGRAGRVAELGGVGEHAVVQEVAVPVALNGPCHVPIHYPCHDLVAARLDILRGLVKCADVRPVGVVSGRFLVGLDELDHGIGLVQNRLVDPGIGVLELDHERDQSRR